MKVNFSEQDKKELARLLRMVQANDGWWPDEETMREAHRTVSFWATEIVIFKQVSRLERKILLVKYDGGIKEFVDRWHIPGGYNNFPEVDVQATVDRVAKRELGFRVRFTDEILDFFKWTNDEHPYGHPLSIYVECEPEEPIAETDSMKFFGLDELPENLLGPHERFARKFLS